MEKEENLGNLYTLRAGLSMISQEKDKLPVKVENAITALADAASCVAGKEHILFLDCLAIKFINSPQEWQKQKLSHSECVSPAERELIFKRYSYLKGFLFDDCKALYIQTTNKYYKYGEIRNLTLENWLPLWISNWTPNHWDNKNGFSASSTEFHYRISHLQKEHFTALPKLKQLYEDTKRLYSKDKEKDDKKHLPENTIRKAAFFRWLSTDECENYLKPKADYFRTYTEEGKHCFSKKNEQARQTREEIRLRCLQETESAIAYFKGLKKTEQAILETMKTEISEVKNTGLTIHRELETSFCKALDPRDWQYIDLLVYYFETGRADTMKEALQLVEREVQTQRIVGAVQEAGRQICKTIMRATAVISAQLNTISSQLSTAIRQQQIQIAQKQIQIAQNERLIAAADLQNALLNKANATSEQLVADVSYIKSYGTGVFGR